MIPPTWHGGAGDCICIDEVSCDLNVLKWEFLVHIGKRIGETIDDILNSKGIAGHHALFVCEGRGLLLLVK
jgi:hypothetical protein